MKQLIFSNTFLLLITYTFLQACKKDNNFPIPNRCGDPSVVVHENHEYDLLFGTGPNQLSAGEISSMVTLPNGNIAWFVNNAMLNSTTGEYLLHNCIVVQNAATTSVKYNSAGSQPKSLVPEPTADGWYSINSGLLYNDKYELIVTLWHRTGPGAFDFAVTGVQVVVLNANDFSIESTRIIASNMDLLFGSAVLQNGGYTYIYGTRNTGYTKEAYVARTPAGTLLQPWSYFDGYNWKINITDARPLLTNVSDVFSVFACNNRFYLVSQAAGFGKEVSIYSSDRPESGWQFNKILYCRSDSNDGFLPVNTKMLFLNNSGRLECSYSLIDGNLQNVQSYRPVFIEIENWQ